MLFLLIESYRNGEERLGVREGSISPMPPLLTQPPMPSLLTQPPEHESSNSIPTNVAPRRVHFKPPGEIETLTRPTNKLQLTQRGKAIAVYSLLKYYIMARHVHRVYQQISSAMERL